MKYIILILLVSGCIANRPTTRIDFEAPDKYPEGIAYDSTSDVFYVSSQRDGSIGKVTPGGVYQVLHADSTLKSSYGMKIHPDGKRLFVCVGDANYSRFTSPDTRRKMMRLISIDTQTGKRLSDIDLSGLLPGDHFGNDITFDNSNNIYMTDSFANAIYKITPDGKASVFTKDKLFETKGVGLNGIVYHPDGFLLVANSATGKIYKVDIHNPKNASEVESVQYFVGADGMLLRDKDRLIIAVNGGNDKIFQIKTDDNWKTSRLSASTLLMDAFTYPATATMKDNKIWIMNAKTTELLDSNVVPSKRFSIQLATLKPLPKK
jgi:sugar lactone lactonase YvrE